MRRKHWIVCDDSDGERTGVRRESTSAFSPKRGRPARRVRQGYTAGSADLPERIERIEQRGPSSDAPSQVGVRSSGLPGSGPATYFTTSPNERGAVECRTMLRTRILAVLFFVCPCASPELSAKEPEPLASHRAAPSYDGPRTADGKPDINGIWQVVNGAAWDIQPRSVPDGTTTAISVVEGGEIPYQPWAAARKDTNYANRLRDDPVRRCSFPGVPRISYMPFPFRISQSAHHVEVTYEFPQAVRTINTDGGSHPLRNDSSKGNSRGRWEDDTLVVHTSHFNGQAWLDAAGNFHSQALHVVERYIPVTSNHLDYQVTIEDSNVFTRPWTMRMPMYRRLEEGLRLQEYDCVEFIRRALPPVEADFLRAVPFDVKPFRDASSFLIGSWEGKRTLPTCSGEKCELLTEYKRARGLPLPGDEDPASGLEPLLEAQIAGDVPLWGQEKVRRAAVAAFLRPNENSQWALQGYFTMMIRFRMMHGDSKPIPPPSFMPKLTWQFLGFHGMQPSMTAVNLTVGHHSNGQRACPFMNQEKDSEGKCIPLPPNEIATTLLNSEEGNFSTHYLQGRVYHTFYGNGYESTIGSGLEYHLSAKEGGGGSLRTALAERYGKGRWWLSGGVVLDRLHVRGSWGRIFHGSEVESHYNGMFAVHFRLRDRPGLSIYGRVLQGQDIYNINFEAKSSPSLDIGFAFDWGGDPSGGVPGLF